jgi:hypothetical protein
MEQDILRPETTPRTSKQAFSPLGCALAAIGAGLSTFSLLGAALAATVWAIVKLVGLPDVALYGLLALSVIPAVWCAVWAGLRAWYVERRLAAGLDIDTPVFKIGHYLKR